MNTLPYSSRGNAYHGSTSRDIFRHNRPGPDHGSLPDRDAGQDDRARSDMSEGADAGASRERGIRRDVREVAHYHVVGYDGPAVDDRAHPDYRPNLDHYLF